MSMDDGTLRRAWVTSSAEQPDPAGCPDNECIWRAVTLDLAADERAALVDHVEGCAACAESWRLAAALAERPAQVERPHSSVPRLARIAAMIGLVAIGGWIAVRQIQGPSSVDRRSAEVTIRSLLNDREALPRERFVLEWTPGPAGTIYDVEVGTSDLRSVTNAFALTEPRFSVPAELLAGFPAGTEIAWCVQATLPDGRVAASVTQLNPIR